MATAPTLPLVSVDEYLNSSYEHDMDYVDGVLVERGMPTVPHSLLQMIIGAYLRTLEQAHGFKVLPEARTQIIARSRYRVPDIVLCPAPLPKKIIDVVPLGVIEILSPDDRMSDTLERFRDYSQIGVQSLVLLDPERYVAWRFDNGSLIQAPVQHLGKVPFDSEAIFEQLRSELTE
jgi:Uma2 family endonuclease